MADGFIVRKGGVTTEQALAPTITEVSTTTNSITFTIKNNDTASATIAFRVSSVTASGQTLTLAADTTSSNLTVSGLADDTTFTVFATANVTSKIKSDVAEKEITTDKAFDPADLSPQLWLDAADASTITESSGSVSQWNNKGSFGNFTQSTGSLQPTTGVTTLNGLNVINFDIDSLIAVNQNEWKILHDGTLHEIFTVVKFGLVADPNEDLWLMGSFTGSGFDNGMAFRYEDITSTNGLLHLNFSGAAANTIGNRSSNNFITPNTFAIVSVFSDASNSTAADRSEIRVNNGSPAKNNTQTRAPSTANPTRALEIGGIGTGIGSLKGSIAELIIISGANVTNNNRTEVINYLADKWGITI